MLSTNTATKTNYHRFVQSAATSQHPNVHINRIYIEVIQAKPSHFARVKCRNKCNTQTLSLNCVSIYTLRANQTKQRQPASKHDAH